jgi:hypothetical protein
MDIVMKYIDLLEPKLKEIFATHGIEKFLDTLGEQRIEQKKERMANLLKIAGSDEAIYREIMLALGYKHNKLQFLELALILPYAEIRKLATQEAIEKALLYRAGFDTTKSGLPEDFDFSLKMKKSVWHYKGVRPANYPERRIKGISNFLYKTLDTGLAETFASEIGKNSVKGVNTTFSKSLCKRLADIFIKHSRGAIGKERAYEIVFNIILPFFIVLYDQQKRVELANTLYDIYDRYPALEDNKITKEMKIRLFEDDKNRAKQVITTIKRYMGLIHLHNLVIEHSGDS